MCTHIAVQMEMIDAELGHVKDLHEAAAMWNKVRSWIDLAHRDLSNRNGNLMGVWTDTAGKAFGTRVGESLTTLNTWAERIKNSHISAVLTGIAFSIPNVHGHVAGLYQDWLKKKRAGETVNDMQYAMEAGKSMDWLADSYLHAVTTLQQALGEPWGGPREALPQAGPSGPAPSSAGPSRAGEGANPVGSPDPESIEPIETKGQPATTDQEDPLKAALAETPNALNALSQAAQSLEQLLGSDQAVPSPLEPDLAGLGSPSSAEVADYLDRMNSEAQGDSGLPSLAGSGGGLPGGGAGGIGAGTSAVNPMSPNGITSAVVPSATSSGAASTAGAASGSPMMPPSAHSPHAAGRKADGGIKPGAAEHAATGRPRERKYRGTPGVSLLGRAGRGKPAKGAVAQPTTAAPQRRWDTENDTVQLLDEELWQVDQNDTTPKYRAGH
jgi:hypothetical protein